MTKTFFAPTRCRNLVFRAKFWKGFFFSPVFSPLSLHFFQSIVGNYCLHFRRKKQHHVTYLLCSGIVTFGRMMWWIMDVWLCVTSRPLGVCFAANNFSCVMGTKCWVLGLLAYGMMVLCWENMSFVVITPVDRSRYKFAHVVKLSMTAGLSVYHFIGSQQRGFIRRLYKTANSLRANFCWTFIHLMRFDKLQLVILNCCQNLCQKCQSW